MFLLLGIVVLILLGMLATAAICLKQSAEAESMAQLQRYNSYLLADQLRQSSDDLTRLARTFVVTGDAKYEKQYWDVLAIRNGKKPVPQNYHRIYWDFMAVEDAPPRPDGEMSALQDLMRQAGFTEDEFAKLKEAQANSDDLVNSETIAMNAVKGRFADESGGFTRVDQPDFKTAINIMHNSDYHQFKAKIMRPVDDFFYLLETRTTRAVDLAAVNKAYYIKVMQWVIVFSCLIMLLVLVFIYRQLIKILGCEPVSALKIVNEISTGNLNTEFKFTAEQSLLAALGRMNGKLRQVIGSIGTTSDELASTAYQLNYSAGTLSQSAVEQMLSIENTSTAINEIGLTISENSLNAKVTEDIANKSSFDVNKGMLAVKMTLDAMQKIAVEVDIIGDIAIQSNLLALNSAIEAARAGENGRGFTVLAVEVKQLAVLSRLAAREIDELVKDGVRQAESAAKLLDEIDPSIKQTSVFVRQISMASQMQNSAIDHIAYEAEQLTKGAQTNSVAANALNDSAQTLTKYAETLKNSVAYFRC